jgi:hypothetical protein
MLKSQKKSASTAVVLALTDAKPPKPNPPNKANMQKWVEQHQAKDQKMEKEVVKSVHYISHAKFLLGLKTCHHEI